MANASKSHDWEVTPEKVKAAVQKIIEVSRPLKLILFGSYVRGEKNVNSDLDVLIIARDDIVNPRKESVRIRRALRGISMPMDIIVVPAEEWIKLNDKPGMIYREVLREGKVVYESKPEIIDPSPLGTSSSGRSEAE